MKRWKAWLTYILLWFALLAIWRLAILTLSLIQTVTQTTEEKMVVWDVTLNFIIDFLLFLFWCFMVRFRRRQWLLNPRWLPFLWLCYHAFYVISALPTILDNDTLKDLAVYIPLLTLAIEYISGYGLMRCFDRDRDNHVCLTWHIICNFSYPEVLRFVSFAIVYYGGNTQDIVFNVLLSILGEIYTHTQIYGFLRHEIVIRCYSGPYDHFSELDHFISSARSYLEYIVPLWVFGFVLIKDNFSDISEVYVELIEKMYHILGAYYLQELCAEIICGAIRQLGYYKRLSAIGKIKGPILILMTVALFFNCQIYSAIWFLEILDGE